MSKNYNTLSGALIVGGTCVGAGMIGLPVLTASVGWLCALICLFLIAGLMVYSACAYSEVTLWFSPGTNLITMAEKILGPVGEKLAWFTYLMLFFSLLAAYTAGGSSMLGLYLQTKGINFSQILLSICFILPFALLLLLGNKAIDICNRFLVFTLILSFVGLCIQASSELKLQSQFEFVPMISDVINIWKILPILITSFGFHAVIPSLRTILNGDEIKLKNSILLGSLLPLIVYCVWCALIFTLVTEEALQLMLLQEGNPSNLLVEYLSQTNRSVHIFVGVFSFVALTSSLLGVSLGMRDFLKDGLNFKNTIKSRLAVTVLTFLPPLIYSLVFPQGFLQALNYGGIFATILLVIYPCLLNLKGRGRGMLGTYQVQGGSLALGVVLVISFIIICGDIISHITN